MLQELTETVRLREDGTERSISKQRAVVKEIVAKAIKGDTRAVSILIAMVVPLQDAAAVVEAVVPLTNDDKTLVDLLTQYMREHGKLPGGEETQPAPIDRTEGRKDERDE